MRLKYQSYSHRAAEMASEIPRTIFSSLQSVFSVASQNFAVGFTYVLLVVFFAQLAFAQTSRDNDVDLPGTDFAFFLDQPEPSLCAAMCARDESCLAWTFVKPNKGQGPQATCWLKSGIPQPVAADCCISGVRLGAQGAPVEPNTDRPGGDYHNFETAGGQGACRAACTDDLRCAAWTFVSQDRVCWLKEFVPPSIVSNCCTSGVSSEWNIDRPGQDIRNFNLRAADPKLCRTACVLDNRCKAWTYVKPNTTQGPRPRCWLKNGIPTDRVDTCCISGIVRSLPNSEEATIFADGMPLANDSPTVSTVENPALTGIVTLRDPVRFSSTRSGESVSCCQRIVLTADRDVFPTPTGRVGRSTLVFVPEQTPIGRTWRFEAPAIRLPADHSIVRLTLSIDGDPVARDFMLRLADDVAALPVHVHTFRPLVGSGPITVTRENWFDWFEPAPVRLRAVTVRNALSGITETSVTKLAQSARSSPPDAIWQDTGVQFRLESFETIRQTQGLERNLFTTEEASQSFGGVCRSNTRLFGFHRSRQGERGIHIYVGSRIPPRGISGLSTVTPAGTCGPAIPSCPTRVDRNDFIVWAAGTRFSEFTLSHELGHYLGVSHPNDDFPCPRNSEVPPPNLMFPAADSRVLSDTQRTRARSLVCTYVRSWGLPDADCG